MPCTCTLFFGVASTLISTLYELIHFKQMPLFIFTVMFDLFFVVNFALAHEHAHTRLNPTTGAFLASLFTNYRKNGYVWLRCGTLVGLLLFSLNTDQMSLSWSEMLAHLLVWLPRYADYGDSWRVVKAALLNSGKPWVLLSFVYWWWHWWPWICRCCCCYCCFYHCFTIIANKRWALKATAVLRRRYRMRYRLFKWNCIALAWSGRWKCTNQPFSRRVVQQQQQSTVEIEMGVEN